MEKPKELPKEKSNIEKLEDKTYAEQLEDGLNIAPIIDQLYSEFEEYAASIGMKRTDELTALRMIKLFLFNNQDRVREVCKNSYLEDWNCLSVSTLACLLAQRKGFDVSIGRDKTIHPYQKLHTFLIRENGEVFRPIETRSKINDPIIMEPVNVINRFTALKPIYKSCSYVINAEDHLKRAKKWVDKTREKFQPK